MWFMFAECKRCGGRVRASRLEEDKFVCPDCNEVKARGEVWLASSIRELNKMKRVAHEGRD